MLASSPKFRKKDSYFCSKTCLAVARMPVVVLKQTKNWLNDDQPHICQSHDNSLIILDV